MALVAFETDRAAQVRRQAPIGKFIVDFVCHEKKIIIEVDGGQHAESATDVARDKWFEDAGYRVLRYWNNDVLRNPNGVLEAILLELSSG